jgi:hypothetical protein
MGLDFMRKSKRDFTKEWSRGLDSVAIADLFDPAFTRQRIILSIGLANECEVEVGEVLSVDRCGEEVRISRGFTTVARVTNPPSDLLAFMEGFNGHALGRIERKGLFGSSAEVLVQCQ